MSYMNKLSQEQLKVIQHNKGLLNVVAGAGTGKTTVLIERVKYLIHNLNVLPQNILILSFNKSTVKEIQKRFFTSIKIMTFHGLSTSILKNNIKLLNNEYNCDFEIMDELKTDDVIKHVLKSDLKLFEYISFFSNIKYFISKIKKNIIDFKNIKNNQLFNYFYNKYCQYLKDNNLIDFDDLNKYTYQILSNNKHKLFDYQNKYQYILIDEIQDIDFYQYQLIKLLSQNSTLFIVGDLNQSIYGFRGSKNIYIDLLVQDFNMITFYLKTNYRSSNKIIKLANNLINYNFSILDKDKYKLKSIVENNCNNKVLYHNFSSVYLENNFIVKTIKNLVKFNNYKYSDIVVLYRKNYLSKNLKDIFLVNNIPYFIKENQKTSFIDKQIISRFNFNKNDYEKINYIKQSLELKFKESLKESCKNKVFLSTIHQIKGLEFKIVFLIGFEKETFMDDFLYKIDIKEERRLAYVAITRAKEQLYITSVKERFVFGYQKELKPISFLQEMGIKGENENVK